MARSKTTPASQPLSTEASVAERKPKSEQTAREMPPPLPTPDWGLWGQMRKVKLFQAVMLSLNIGPVSASELTARRYWTFDYNQKLAERLTIATNHLSIRGPLHPRDADGAVTSAPLVQPELFTTVDLAEFYEFALARGWKIPKRFPQPKPATSSVSNQPPVDPKHIREKGVPWTDELRIKAKELVTQVGIKEASLRCGGITVEALRQQLEKLNTPSRRAHPFSI